MPRVFVAINLPEEIKEKLDNLEKEIEELFPPEQGRGLLKWVPKENLHLTLLFVGTVPTDKTAQLCQLVQEITQTQNPFPIKIFKVCYGPSPKMPPRLIWLALEKNKELLKIASGLKEKIFKSGFLRRIEEREFSPHITLARIRTWQWRQIEPEERPDIERELGLEFEVKSVEVMESQLKRSGAEYKVLESCNLKPET